MLMRQIPTALTTDDIDTDDDQINDGDEVLVFGTNPLSIDTDNDGLEDGREILVNGTDPLDNDTDDDGLEDGAEVNVMPILVADRL